MRIAINSRLLVPGKTDGIARFTIETFKRICAENPEVDFTFIYDRNSSDFDFGKNSHKVSLFPPARHPILWYLWFEHSLRRFLNKNKFDLYVSPEGWVPPKLKMPALAVMHDLNFIHQEENVAKSHRQFLQYFFPKYAERADRIATVSNYSKKDIASTFSYPEDKIDVVFNGVNDTFQALSAAEQKEVRAEYTGGNEYFIFIGTLHPRKNLDHLFLAFDRFKREGQKAIKLLVVGNKKWWPDELEKIYDQMEFKQDVIFTGRLSDERVSRLLASSRALTYLPHFEGFGIPILEAFACKTAVITANNTSLPEVAGDAALLCNSRSTKEITQAMKQMAENAELRNKLIQRGSEQLQKFSWDQSAQLLWQSMQRCLKKNGA